MRGANGPVRSLIEAYGDIPFPASGEEDIARLKPIGLTPSGQNGS
jgi:hypothetical protein